MIYENELDDAWQRVLHSLTPLGRNEDQLELLPVLRARYGDMLRTEIVSVLLVFAQRGYSHTLRIWELQGDPRVVILETDFSDSMSNDLHYLFERMSVEAEFLAKLRLFKPHSQNWLLRHVRTEGQITDYEYAADSAKKHANSCLKNLTDVADHFAPGLAKAFIDNTSKKLRSSPSHGVDEHEAVKTEWDELGRMQSESDHPLAQMGLDTLAWTLEKQFKALDESEKLLLWIKYGNGASEIESLAGEYVHPSDYGDAFDQVLEYLTRKIVGAAVNDWEKKSDRS